MAAYFFSLITPAGSRSSRGASGFPTSALTRMQNYVDTTGTGGSRYLISRLDAPAAGSNLTTPEQGNTRSPAPADSYYNATSVATRHTLVALSFATFNPSGWSAQPRYSVSAMDTDGLLAELNTVTVTAQVFDIFEENLESKNWVRGRMRRTTKRGYWPMMGNTIFRVTVGTVHQCPLWQNDLTFVDRWAWRNRGTETGINVNLFPPPVVAVAPQRCLLGAGT